MEKYKERIVDGLLSEKLEGMGAVLIEGPKWCGKTTTAEYASQSTLYMSDPAEKEQNLQLAAVSPQTLLAGETPRLIDEWQLAPALWDAVRFEVDHRDGVGQFILTGSAVPPDTRQISHTGTGRIARLHMRTMSLFESGDSNGCVRLGELFANPPQIYGVNELSINDIAYLICRGGWPIASMQKRSIALERAFDYYNAIVKVDISRVDEVKRNPERAKRLMRSYARHQGSQASLATIGDDVRANDGGSLAENTLYDYLNALRKIFVIEDMEAWNPNLRSKTAIRTADTRYFSDPSIGTAALGLGPEDLIADLKTMGLFFETMCIRDLRVFAESLKGNVFHYRDKNGLECDAVIHLRNGSYGLVEIKLGGDKLIAEGVKNLNALAGKIDTDKMKAPAFKMVLTGVGRYAFRREDGVYIVPIGCLRE